MYEKKDNSNEILPLQSSSDDEDKEHEAPITDTLEEKGGAQIYMQKMTFSKAQLIRLYELISNNLQNWLRNGKGEKLRLAPLHMQFNTLRYRKNEET